MERAYTARVRTWLRYLTLSAHEEHWTPNAAERPLPAVLDFGLYTRRGLLMRLELQTLQLATTRPLKDGQQLGIELLEAQQLGRLEVRCFRTRQRRQVWLSTLLLE